MLFYVHVLYFLNLCLDCLTAYQIGAYCSGVTIFNTLPTQTKNASDLKKFNAALKHLLYTYSFYTMDEYFSRYTSLRNCSVVL